MSDLYWCIDNEAKDATFTSRTANTAYPSSNLAIQNIEDIYRSGDKALVADGVYSYAYIDDTSAFDLTGDITIETVVKCTSASTSSTFDFIVSKWNGATDNRSYGLAQFDATFRLGLNSTGAGANNNFNSPTGFTLTADTWYRVKVVYDSSAQAVTWYINGTSYGNTVNTGSIPASVYNGNTRLVVSGNDYGGERFRGEISYVGIVGIEYDNSGYLDPSVCAGYWAFDGDLTDSSGQGNDLNWQSVLGLDGSTEYATLADHPDFDITGDLTIEALVRCDSNSTGSTFDFIVSKWNSTGNQRSYGLAQFDNTFRLALNSGGGSGTNNFNSPSGFTITALVWYRVKAVYDASAQAVTWYINGSSYANSVVSGSIPASLYSGSSSLAVGSNGAGTENFDGGVAIVAIDNVESDNVTSLAPTTCQGYWRFEGDLTDDSGNSHTLTGTNIDSSDYLTTLDRTFNDCTAFQWIRANFSATKNPTYWYIDRNHNVSAGVTVRLLRQSPFETYDSEDTYTVVADQPIFNVFSGTTDVDWWLEINDPDNADGYIEIPYIYLGDKVNPDTDVKAGGGESYAIDVYRPTITGINPRGTKRTYILGTAAYGFSGVLSAATGNFKSAAATDFQRILDLFEWASQGHVFPMCLDDSDATYEAAHLFTVELENMDAFDMAMQVMKNTGDDEKWNVLLQLREPSYEV